jgi:hypothetical protein
MKKLLRLSLIVPLLLAVYLGVMVVLGWDSYVAGATSPLLYFGGTALVLCCIILLHLHLKHRESLRKDKQ